MPWAALAFLLGTMGCIPMAIITEHLLNRKNPK
jgi:hypothetical protein